MVPEGTSSDIMEHVIHRSSRIKPLSFAVVSCPQCCSRDALRFKCKTCKGTLIIYKNRFWGKNTILQSWKFKLFIFTSQNRYEVSEYLLNLLVKLASNSQTKWSKLCRLSTTASLWKITLYLMSCFMRSLLIISWFFDIHSPRQIISPSLFPEKGHLKTNLDQF